LREHGRGIQMAGEFMIDLWSPMFVEVRSKTGQEGIMKTIGRIAVLWVFVAALTSVSHAEAIKRAVLYDSMAHLTFEKTISGMLVLDGTPDMIVDSLTATPVDTAMIRSVTVEPQRMVSGAALDLKERLTRRKAALDLKSKTLTMVEKQVAVIYGAALAGDKDQAFEAQHVAEALNFIEGRIPGLNAQQVALSQEIEKLEIEVKDLQSQLDRISTRQGFRIVIEAEGVVEISYVVRNASWTPLYRVLSSPDAGELIIDASARIHQTTGMDWEIETLAVSTGRPSFGIQAPEIGPWYLEAFSRGPRTAFKSMEDTHVSTEATPLQGAEVSVEVTSTSFVVGVARGILLPGDGTWRTIDLGRTAQQGVFTRIAIPKYRESAFLRAEATLSGSIPVLPGTYFAFVDGVFSGRGTLRNTQPGEKMEIDLGIDEGIGIERTLKERYRDKTLLGKNRVRYTYEMTVKNARTSPVLLKLKDHIPLSRDQNIKVELLGVTPRVEPDDDGILAWNLQMDPGQITRVTLSFSITGETVSVW